MPASHRALQSTPIMASASVGRQQLAKGRRTPNKIRDHAQKRVSLNRARLRDLGCCHGLVTGVGSCFTLFTLRTICKHFAIVHTVAKFLEPVTALFYALKSFLKFHSPIAVTTHKQPCDTMVFDQCYCSHYGEPMSSASFLIYPLYFRSLSCHLPITVHIGKLHSHSV